jgi:hypothetical protein
VVHVLQHYLVANEIVVLLRWAERLHRSADPFSEPRPGAGTSHW